LACETDFVAKNETFHELAEKILDILSKVEKDIERIEDIDETFFEGEIKPLINEYI
jgi:translation elongation factor EF-Ts